MPCFIRAEAEDPVCVRHEAAQSRLAQTRGLGAGSAHARRRGDRHGTGTGPGGRDAIQGLPTSMQVRLAESKGRDPGCSFGPKTIPPATRSAFVVYWAPGPPPKPNPPSSRFRVAAPQSRLAPSRLAPSRLAPSRLAPSRLAPSRLAPSRLAPSRLAPSRLAPSRLAPSRLAPSRLAPSRLAPSRLAPSRLALRRLDATPPPGAGQIITGQLPSGRPARCWTVCRNLPRIRAMSTREIVTLRIPERGRPARITDQRLHRGVRSGACDGA